MIGASLKHSICRLFEVIDDEAHVKRVITPLEFANTGYAVVVRVRPLANSLLMKTAMLHCLRRCQVERLIQIR
jgi:hypothetical protein